jgi:hypothetical protein
MLKKSLLALTLTMTMLTGLALAQDVQPLIPQGPAAPAPGWNNSGNWMVPTMGPNRRIYQDEMWRFKLGARVGYQWLNYNVTFPYNSNPDPTLQVFAFERMDLELRNSDYWVGYLDVELQPIQNLILYAIWGGNAPKEFSNVKMSATGAWTRPDPPNGGNTVSPWYWDTRFQWWTLDVGAVYWLSSEIGVEAGFRSEHTDFKMLAPRNETTEGRGTVGPGPNGVTIPCDRI